MPRTKGQAKREAQSPDPDGYCRLNLFPPLTSFPFALSHKGLLCIQAAQQNAPQMRRRGGNPRILALVILLLCEFAPARAIWTEETSVGSTEAWLSISSSIDGTKLAAVINNDGGIQGQ